MITEDKIAAAQIAQIFGGELLHIEKNVTHKSSQTPSAIRMDPKKILTGQHAPQLDEITLQRQREADLAHPSTYEDSAFRQANQVAVNPPQPAPPQQVPSSVPVAIHTQTIAPVAAVPSQIHSFQNDIFEKINKNLERIANRLDSLDIVVRKRRIRPIQINETGTN